MVEPAIDLGIVMAVVSSYRNKIIPKDVIVFGEVGLSGEVRSVSQPELRVAEAKKLGFQTCILPKSALAQAKRVTGIKLLGIGSLSEILKYL